MNLDPKTKIQLVSEIWGYFKEQFCKLEPDRQTDEPTLVCDNRKIKLFLQYVGDDVSGKYGFYDENELLKIEDQKLVALHNYIKNQKSEGLADLFTQRDGKYAIQTLEEEEKFSNLKIYLEECFECVKANKKLAAALLLRSCVEILVMIKGFKVGTLASKIEDKLIPSIESDEDFKIFAKYGKKEELKQLLKGIKNFGNDAAHLNGKNARDFIEEYDGMKLLKLFCLLIQHSILKEEINKRSKHEEMKSFKSTDFTPSQKTAKAVERVDSDDDEIPF